MTFDFKSSALRARYLEENPNRCGTSCSSSVALSQGCWAGDSRGFWPERWACGLSGRGEACQGHLPWRVRVISVVYYFFPTVRCGAVENCRTKGQSRLQVRSLPLPEATLSPFLVLSEMMRDPYLDL